MRFRCRDSLFSIEEGVLRNAPVLETLISARWNEKGAEEIEIERNPVPFGELLSFCETGRVDEGAINSELLDEFIFWGAASPRDRNVRYTEDVEEETRRFVALLLETDPSSAPVRDLLVNCCKYSYVGPWSPEVDAYRFAIAYPKVLRTCAFVNFGVELTWKEVDVVRDESRTDEWISTAGETLYNERNLAVGEGKTGLPLAGTVAGCRGGTWCGELAWKDGRVTLEAKRELGKLNLHCAVDAPPAAYILEAYAFDGPEWASTWSTAISDGTFDVRAWSNFSLWSGKNIVHDGSSASLRWCDVQKAWGVGIALYSCTAIGGLDSIPRGVGTRAARFRLKHL